MLAQALVLDLNGCCATLNLHPTLVQDVAFQPYCVHF
jgi:hypothetical protein